MLAAILIFGSTVSVKTFLWYSKNILMNNKTVYNASFSNKSLNYVSQLFDIFEKIKQWSNFKTEFHLCENIYFAFMQLVDSLPSVWKKLLKQTDLSPVIQF